MSTYAYIDGGNGGGNGGGNDCRNGGGNDRRNDRSNGGGNDSGHGETETRTRKISARRKSVSLFNARRQKKRSISIRLSWLWRFERTFILFNLILFMLSLATMGPSLFVSNLHWEEYIQRNATRQRQPWWVHIYEKDPGAEPQNTEEEFASDDSNGGDAGNRNYATTLTQQKARAKRLLRALKACQAERDNLSKQVNVDARVKEFLDSQVSDLELKLKALQKENNDLVTQVEADSRMKEFLADQWEASRLELEEVTENLQAISAERDSIAMQVEADQRIKEYLSEQWERSESMRREAESQNSNDMQLFGHSRRQAANGARRRRNEPSMGRYA